MAGMEPHEPGSAPLLIVISGPSGVGKDTVLSRMKEQGRGYHFTVTATTRRRRPTERDGVDYIFHSEQTFRAMIEQGELIEWAEVHGHLYGVPKAQVKDAMGVGWTSSWKSTSKAPPRSGESPAKQCPSSLCHRL